MAEITPADETEARALLQGAIVNDRIDALVALRVAEVVAERRELRARFAADLDHLRDDCRELARIWDVLRDGPGVDKPSRAASERVAELWQVLVDTRAQLAGEKPAPEPREAT